MEFEDKAKEAEKAGDYRSAINYYSQALAKLKIIDAEEDLQFKWGNLVGLLANLYTELGDFDNAISCYKDAIAKHKGSWAYLDKILRNMGENSSKLGLCFIIDLEYEEALGHFEKAIEYLERCLELEEQESIIPLVEQILLNFAFKIFCLFNLDRGYKEILPVLEKAVQLTAEHDLESFSSDLIEFSSAAIFKNIKDAYAIFKRKIQNATDGLPFRSVLQAVAIGLIWDFANQFIPQLRIQVKDKEDGDEGEIVLTRQCYEDMLLYGFSFANGKMPSSDFREVIALIVGKIKKGNVIVSNIVPMTSGTEKEVEFKDEHYAKAAEVNSEAAERDEFIVGWFHTHPNLGLFLSATDIFNQLGYQSLNEKAIAIEFDFTQLTPSNSGFAFFRLDDAKLATASYHTVKWRIKEPTKNFYSDCISLFSRILSDLNHTVLKNGQMPLAQLAKELGRSELLLEEIIPNLIELEHLPNLLYDPETKMISKSN
ncbi:MAG: tetratricopeptide repeat protein [Candidatus Helarchaeota archaeon]|nr:tetratricopeptide repeat protein [Candidatus Helarchaeota archaeon]